MSIKITFEANTQFPALPRICSRLILRPNIGCTFNSDKAPTGETQRGQMADDKIKALSARHRRIETKLAALRAKAFGLNDVLHRAFEGTDIVGISCTVTLEQIRYDE